MNQVAETTGRQTKRKRLRWPGLSTQIFLGFGLGVACSLFLGDYCQPLQTVGDLFSVLRNVLHWVP
jgi:hypothetical protein